MTVSTIYQPERYVGNNSTTVYPYHFEVASSSHMKVSFDGSTQGGGYTVSGVGSDTGGSVTFSVAPGTGVIVVLERNAPVSRDDKYQPNGMLPESTLESDPDYITMLVQQAMARIDRAPVLDPRYGVGPYALPYLAAGYLRWNGGGTALEAVASPIGVQVTTAGSLYVNSITDLKNLAAGVQTYVEVGGYSVKGDGGGGQYYWDAASALADNGGTVIRPASLPATGRWLLQTHGLISVLQFGADPTGVADSKAAFQAAVDALPSTGGTINIPIGTYKITAQVLVSGKTGIRFLGASKDGSVLVKTFTGNPMLRFLNANHWQIDSVFLQGVSDASGTDSLLYVEGSSYGLLENSKVFNGRGYGCQIAQGAGVSGSYFNTLSCNHFFNNGRSMAGVTGANIYCGTESSETKVISGECQAAIGAGWLIEGGNGHVGLGVSFEGNGEYGVKVGTASVACSVNLFGCRFEGAGVMNYGIRVLNALSTVGIWGCQITSNVIADVSDPDVALISWSGNSVSTSPAAYRAVGVTASAGATGFNYSNGFCKISSVSAQAVISSNSALVLNGTNGVILDAPNNVIYMSATTNRFNWQVYTGLVWQVGSGSPEGAITGAPGSLYTNNLGGANTTLYIKESGTGNTGWIAK